MSVSHIPEKTKIILWGKAAGRCQYKGCNKVLYRDSITKAEFNTAYIAHIIADSIKGPRGDSILSEKLKDDISNLMLMCDEHHRLIDKGDVEGHPVALLNQMKENHETRIEMITSLDESCQSHVILYCANIGEHSAIVNFNKVVSALLPHKYPAEKPAIEIGLQNSSFYDNEEIYWMMEKENLKRNFKSLITPKLLKGEIEHFSIFAIAPQPLLIELGRLISDIHVADIYQLHKEPSNWEWQQKSSENNNYQIIEPSHIYDNVAINFSLSATINNERITNIMSDEISIWTITIENPNNDFMKSKNQLTLFREKMRSLFNKIKTIHGKNTIINIFPAVPVSIAVEIGRVWMPKSDLPMVVYDQNRKENKFIKALIIGEKNDNNS